MLPTDHRDLKNLAEDYVKKRLAAHSLTYEEYEHHWHLWIDMVEREHFNQDYDLWVQKFKKITIPTLIIAGSDDPLGPVAQAEHLQKHIKNSR